MVALVANHEVVVHVFYEAIALVESLGAKIFAEDAKDRASAAATNSLPKPDNNASAMTKRWSRLNTLATRFV